MSRVIADTPRLSPRALNRALLARQRLLAPAPAPVPIPAVLEAVGGIQAQYAPSMYFGLWSRGALARREELTELLESDAVVQGTLMRSTIHLVSAGDYWPFARAVREARRRQWLRSQRAAPSAAQLAGAARKARPRLAERPLTRRELEDLLGAERARALGLWLDLLRVPPAGTWERRRADLYALAEQRLGPDPGWTERAAVVHVVLRYLQAFGPARGRDVANWAGLPVTPVTAALRDLDLVRFTGPGDEELLDRPDAPRPDPETPVPVRLLPTWDATLLVHARGAGVLPEDLRPRVFSVRNPTSTPTFLVDGAVAGAWRLEDGRVELEPWRRLDAATRRELEAEGERLAAFSA